MKKPQLILITLCLFLIACSLPPQYTGYRLPATKHVTVFYTAADAKMDYSVMGRLSSHKYPLSIVVKNFSTYAQSIGADAIILLPVDAKSNRDYADVLKYK
jgi:hypothetical protein